MSTEEETPAPEQDWHWRLVKRDGGQVTLELGDEYVDFEGPLLTALTHRIGEALIKVGTQFLQSRVHDEDEEDW